MPPWTSAQVYATMLPNLNEKQKRLYVASEALRRGYGGISTVSRESGISRVTITNGIKEVRTGAPLDGRIRKKGGGGKKHAQTQHGITDAIKKAARPKGNPMDPILYTSRSMEHIADEVKKQGYTTSRMSVYRTLKAAGFALKANKKNIEGAGNHPDRDAQFQHINSVGLAFQLSGDPVISADCKKKELIGNFKNNGREWVARGEETSVNVYDFASLGDGKAIPYGVYDVFNKNGFVNVGVDHTTAEFAVESIRRWWKTDGHVRYATARRLLILVDGGNPNSSRSRLWKKKLQELSNETGLALHICHYPPYTSKWNAIEHELFSFISINWRAKPLVSLEVVLELIAHTTTTKGLTVQAVKDTNRYPTGLVVSEQEMAQLNITRNDFHGDWNYVIKPQIRS